MKRFVVRVQAGDPNETQKAREVRHVLQRLVDTFISSSSFDMLGLHTKGCQCKNLCDGSGGIPGSLVLALTSKIQPAKIIKKANKK